MQLLSAGETWAWIASLWDKRRNRWLTREQIDRMHREKFRKLSRHVYRHSPYYRALMDDRGLDPDTCMPSDFPVLTKRQLMDNFDDVLTAPGITRERVEDFLAGSIDPAELMDGCYHVLHTSGTSGCVGYFVYSHKEWIRASTHISRLAPLRFGRRVAYVAATRGHFAGASLMITGNHGTNALFYNVMLIDVNQPLTRIIAALNEFQPHSLSGYSAIMKVLAAAREAGQLRIRPNLVSGGGEPLTADVRSYIESVFEVPMANVYASTEALFMGIQFPEDRGMYLMEDDLIFELHDDHTCITNLFCLTTPLIRYRIDDVLLPTADGAQRLPFTKIREVVGRYEDALVFVNRDGEEDCIHPIVIVEFLVKGLCAWQIVCHDRHSFTFRAVYAPSLSLSEKLLARHQTEQRMRAILEQKNMSNVQFEIEEVDDLPVDPRTGKFRLVVKSDNWAIPALA